MLCTLKHALLLRNTNPRKRLKGLTAWEKFYADQPDKAALLVEIHAKMLPLGTKVVYYRPQKKKTAYRGERGIIVGLCLHTSPVSYIVETEKGTIIEVAKVIVTSTLPLHLIEEGLQDAPGLSNEGESEDENDDKDEDEDDGHSQTSYEEMSENDVKLHVQPTESHGEVVDISCTEGAEYDYGHILDRSVAPKTALDATSSASDVKLETLPALQHDEECGGFQLQVGFTVEEEIPGLRPLRLVKVKTSDQSDKEQALVDSGADASIFRSSDEVHDLEPASLRLEVGNGEYVDCPGVGNVKALVTVYKNGRRSGTAHLKIRAYWSQDVPHGIRILSVLDLCKQGMTVVFPNRDDKLGHRIVLADGRYIKVKDMEITAIFEKSGVVGIEEKLMSSHMGRVDRFHRCMSASDILRQKIITAHVRFGHLGGEMLRKCPNRTRSEEHTSELQSHSELVCRLLLEKKKKKQE